MMNKLGLKVEFIAIYIITPLIIYLLPPFPVLPVLWVFTLLLMYLLKMSGYSKSKPIFNRISLLRMIIRFVGLASILTIGVYLFKPELLFSLIKERPIIWLVVVILYPLLSVYPQEFIYRVFFFHRYKDMFKNRNILIHLNGILFGYIHIIFHNWIAVVLTATGGILFAYTYERSRSLLMVSIEHSLFGVYLFTIGLGDYFYMGTIGTISQF
jgi:membrane protease YdiL (CAAX protease family)